MTRSILSLTILFLLTFTHAQLSRNGFFTEVFTYAGNGSASNTDGLISSNLVSINSPDQLFVSNKTLFVRAADTLRTVNSKGMLSTLSLTASSQNELNGNIISFALASDETMYIATNQQTILKVTFSQSAQHIGAFCGTNNTINATQAQNCSIGTFTSIMDLYADSEYLYILESDRLSKVLLSNQTFVEVYTFEAHSDHGRFCTSQETLDALYLTRAHTLQRFAFNNLTEGETVLSGVVGNASFAEGDTPTSVRYNTPEGCDIWKGTAYIADQNNHRLRFVSLTAPYNAVSLAGGDFNGTVVDSTLSESRFCAPSDIIINHQTLDLFFTSKCNNTIKGICLCNPEGSYNTTCDMSLGFGVCSCKSGYTGNRCQGAVSNNAPSAAANLLQEATRFFENTVTYAVGVEGAKKLAQQVQTLKAATSCSLSETCRLYAQESVALLASNFYASVAGASEGIRSASNEMSLLQTLTGDLELVDIAANEPLRKTFQSIQCTSSLALINATLALSSANSIMQHAVNVQRGESARANTALTSGLQCLAEKYSKQADLGDRLSLTTPYFQFYSLKQNATILSSHTISFFDVEIKLSAGMTVLPDFQSFTVNGIKSRAQLASNEVSRVEVSIIDQKGYMNVTGMDPPTEFTFDVSSFNPLLGLATGEFESGHKFVCKYLNDNGEWSTSGVTTKSMSRNSVTCTTSHFSTFAVLYQYQDVSAKDDNAYWITMICIFGFFSAIAVIFACGLLAVLIFNLISKERRRRSEKV